MPRRWTGAVVIAGLLWVVGPGRAAAPMQPHSAPADPAARTLVLGLAAQRPPEVLAERWLPLADYLGQALPGYRLDLRILDLDALGHALRRKEIDVVFTSPVHYLRLREENALTGALATVVRRVEGEPVYMLGGVAVTLAGRTDIRTYADLIGQRVAAGSADLLGGYVAHLREVAQQGLDPRELRPRFVGPEQDRVIRALQDGAADVGLIRTGVLEAMIAEGRLAADALEVIAPRRLPGYAHALSTRLYPEWPVATLPHVDRDIARRLARALLSLPADHPAARAAGIDGFDIPADYSDVDHVLRDLRLPPYNHPPEVTLSDIWAHQRAAVLLAAAALAVILILALLLALSNRLLRAARAAAEAAERRWLLALDGAGHGAWDWSPEDGRVVYSRQWKAMLGYGEGEIGDSLAEWSRRVHPDDLESALAAVRAHLDGRSPVYRHTHRLRARDGSYRWILDQGMVCERDAGGRPLRVVGTHTDITRLHAAEQALAESERRFRAIFEQAAVGIAQVGLDGHWLGVNQTLCDFLGYSREQLQALDFQSITHPDDLDADLGALAETLAGKRDHYQLDKRYLRRDGGTVWAELTVALVRDASGAPDYFISVVADIGERRAAQEALRQTHMLYRRLVEHMSDGVAIYEARDGGREFVVRDVNPAGLRSVDLRLEDVVGRRASEVFPGIEAMGLLEVLCRVDATGRAESLPARRYEAAGRVRWFENFVYRLPSGEVVAVFTDVTERRATEHALLESRAELERIAYYDALTGLPNRRLLIERLDQAIAAAESQGGLLAACFLDLDDFKPINDAHGHDVGDALLVAVAERLRRELRVGDTVARWGGDEFAVLLSALPSLEACEEILSRMLASLVEAYQVKGHGLRVSASVGVALYPSDHADGETLLRHADQAMYQAKQRGRNRYQFFDSEAAARAAAHRSQIERIGHAVARDELFLLCQPIVDMRRGRVEGVEVLVRWRHPDQGVLLPSAFIPLVDGGQLMRRLDAWVLERALEHSVQWQGSAAEPCVHINLSAHTLTAPGFVDWLSERLARHPGIRREFIFLEILETAALDDLEQVTEVIHRASALGVRFVLDDFGTGYSSLTYFRHLPADVLKVDQSFVRDMLEDQDDLRIVEAVIGLAEAFNRTVVAEGVESIAHGTLLLRLGCDLGQGFGIAAPMPAEDLVAWIDAYRPPAEWQQAALCPWDADDLILFRAEADHRAWVAAVIARALGDPRSGPAHLDEDQCRFGRWYRGSGKRFYGDLPAFDAVESLHAEVHRLGIALMQGPVGQAGRDAPAVRDLERASERLLDGLARLREQAQDSERHPVPRLVQYRG